MKKSITKFCFAAALILGLGNHANSQAPQAKIDFNMNGRPATEVQEPGWTPWVVTNRGPDSIKVNNVEFIVRKGRRGDHLAMTYFKAGVQAPNLARLTCDGMFVKDGDFALGSEIELTIRGLPTGTHSLVTYHNAMDNLTPTTVCPLDVHVDGVQVIDNLLPSIRVFKETESATARLQIKAVDGKDVVIRLIADTTGNQATKSIFINAIALNITDVNLLSRTPNPAHKDEHIDAPGNSYKLGWETSPTATSHDIYFGKDSAAVANADKSSSLYKGNQTRNDSSYTVNGLYSMDTYYWRVDEVDGNGTHKGAVWMFRSRQLAFSSAEGFGRFARGGRGGKIVEVTNLNDDGPGSFREAITNDIGPRTIVFTVSGIIQLKSRLVLAQPYVTVAGQTAPGKGICLRSSPFGIGANDAILRHIRLRLGGGPTADGMGMNGDHSIMDHCSISWTIDEAFSSRGAKNITLQRTLISEALNIAGHKNYPAGKPHGFAATIGGSKGSFHHNLIAHCAGRNWSLGGGLDGDGFYAGLLDITNNVVYNWNGRTTDGGAHKVNFVNNYYKPGAAIDNIYALTAQHEAVGRGTQQYYFAGNVMPGYFDESTQEKGRRYQGNPTWETWVNQPFFASEITEHSARDAYKHVLSDVGASQPFFDNQDTRMVRETLEGSFSIRGSKSNLPGLPDDESDVGGYEDYPALTRAANWDSDHDGMPDWWEKIHGFNPNSPAGDFSESNGDPDKDGFTHLEAYLEWMAQPHYMVSENQTLDIDLKKYSKGFEKTPVFTLSNIVKGNVAIVNDSIARFTSTAPGLASLSFTVTDADGSTMTRTIGLLVDNEISLPVTLTSFEANRTNKQKVTLNWKTSQETNNSHFVVYRSLQHNGQNAVAIATVKSKAENANSNQPLSYSFVDQNSTEGLSYYKIVQVDKDGASRFSETRIVRGIGNDKVFKIWPVPSNGNFKISIAGFNGIANIEVYDVQGRLVLTKKINDNTLSEFNLSRKGVYYLKVLDTQNGSQILYNEKLIVQ